MNLHSTKAVFLDLHCSTFVCSIVDDCVHHVSETCRSFEMWFSIYFILLAFNTVKSVDIESKSLAR